MHMCAETATPGMAWWATADTALQPELSWVWITVCRMSEHAGEADKIEQSYRNGLTYATKHKETRKHKRFRQNIVFFRCKRIDR